MKPQHQSLTRIGRQSQSHKRQSLHGLDVSFMPSLQTVTRPVKIHDEYNDEHYGVRDFLLASLFAAGYRLF